MIGEYVVVRTRSAGVHCGTLVESAGTAVLLAGATRLWRWYEAFSLHEVSQFGVGERSKISEAVPRVLLTEAIEVIPCSDQAKASLSRPRNNPSASSE